MEPIPNVITEAGLIVNRDFLMWNWKKRGQIFEFDNLKI
jgi:hypothetical protein